MERTEEQVQSRWAWPWPASRFALIAYGIVLAWYCLTEGFPMDRVGQAVWIMAGILAGGIGKPLRRQAMVFLHWLPLIAALILYDKTRGIADTLGMPVRIVEIADFDRALFGGTVPTVWLQEHLHNPEQIYWYDTLISMVYFSHFFFPWVVATAFYIVSKRLWWPYIRRVLLLTYLGLLTYILLPAAPPWYAAWYDYISDDIWRLPGRGWENLGLHGSEAWFAEANGDVNHVAAMPSLHAAFSLLVAVSLWPLVAKWKPWARWTASTVVASYPLAMAITLVYAGEHYVIDIIAGWLFVMLVCGLARLWEKPGRTGLLPISGTT